MEKKSILDLSLVMPMYNSGQFLEESIESILNQTFDNFEFIIVYDKSNDNNKHHLITEITEEYFKNVQNIEFFYQD